MSPGIVGSDGKDVVLGECSVIFPRRFQHLGDFLFGFVTAKAVSVTIPKEVFDGMSLAAKLASVGVDQPGGLEAVFVEHRSLIHRGSDPF